MKINLLKVSGLALLVLALFVLSGCRSVAPAQTVRTPQIKSVSDMGFLEIVRLLQGLSVMGSNHAVAMHNGETIRDGEIPSRYWSEPIKALHPIKVYHDVGNTVIVQTITNGFEYGKYITPFTSSYGAQGDFHLTPTHGPVSDYRKQAAPYIFGERNKYYLKPRLHQFYELIPND